MLVTISTTSGEPLTGTIFTEGSYNDENCFAQYSEGPPSVIFRIPFNACKTTLKDGEYRNTLVIQRHPTIMTGEDGAFVLACALRQGDRNPVIKIPQQGTDQNLGSEEATNGPSVEKVEYHWEKVTSQKGTKTLYSDQGTYTYLPMKNGSDLRQLGIHPFE